MRLHNTEDAVSFNFSKVNFEPMVGRKLPARAVVSRLLASVSQLEPNPHALLPVTMPISSKLRRILTFLRSLKRRVFHRAPSPIIWPDISRDWEKLDRQALARAIKEDEVQLANILKHHEDSVHRQRLPPELVSEILLFLTPREASCCMAVSPLFLRLALERQYHCVDVSCNGLYGTITTIMRLRYVLSY
jgi:hypothetical protein